jgi:hypothetical protein
LHKYAAEVDPDSFPGDPAHNNWYLTLGELGRPGLVALALLWLRFFATPCRFMFAVRAALHAGRHGRRRNDVDPG